MSTSPSKSIRILLCATLLAVGLNLPTYAVSSRSQNSQPVCASINFAPATNIYALNSPGSLAVGDFNKDGKPDLAVANLGSDNVSVFMGNGDGTFATAYNYNVGSTQVAVVVADFDGDGNQDMATINYAVGGVSVFLGDGAGNFGNVKTYDLSAEQLWAGSAGDFDNDGKSDLVLAKAGLYVMILLSDGAGSFSSATDFSVGKISFSVSVADFNKDGKKDLVASNGPTNSLSVLLGDGSGSFSPPTSLAVGNSPHAAVSADFNSDGDPDLVSANSSSGNTSILLGTGTGTFSSAVNTSVGGTYPLSITATDFNGDGKPDLATTNRNSNNVSILLGAGTGSFSPAVNISVGTTPYSAVVGDFNRDSKPDLAVANYGSNTISVLLNNCDSTPPLVSSTSLLLSYKTIGPASFSVTFSEAVFNPDGDSGEDDVTNIDNFLVIEEGPNSRVDTVSCKDGLKVDDLKIEVTGVSYSDRFALVTLAAPLKVGAYRIFVCGTTSILDLGLNPLGGGVDTTLDFMVNTNIPATGGQSKTLPGTGFPQDEITRLSVQPTYKAYTSTALILEIPTLKIATTIVGVPRVDGNWDVTWLGNEVGWLNGSAYPTWAGNTVLTGHVWNADNTPGLFVNLKNLKYGDQLKLRAFGQIYTYEIRESRALWPDQVDTVMQHFNKSTLTLLTCEDYHVFWSTYSMRRMLRAVLVSIE